MRLELGSGATGSFAFTDLFNSVGVSDPTYIDYHGFGSAIGCDTSGSLYVAYAMSGANYIRKSTSGVTGTFSTILILTASLGLTTDSIDVSQNKGDFNRVNFIACSNENNMIYVGVPHSRRSIGQCRSW